MSPPPPPIMGEPEKKPRRSPRHPLRLPHYWGRGGTLFPLALLLCAGCTPHPAALPREDLNPDLRLALDTTPNPPSSLDPTTFTVRASDAKGRPVSGATVSVRLDMPAMPMGDNGIGLKPGVVGAYTGTGRFTMAGDWRVTVTAAQGGRSATQGFSLRVR